MHMVIIKTHGEVKKSFNKFLEIFRLEKISGNFPP